MIRLWPGIFLLAASWLPGTGYYRAPQWIAWAVLLVVGVACVVAARWSDSSERNGATNGSLPLLVIPSGAVGLICVGMLGLPLWISPWPHRAAPLLLAAGLLIGWCRRKGALTSTGLQPDEQTHGKSPAASAASESGEKPLKRLGASSSLDTGLKPGAKERADEASETIFMDSLGRLRAALSQGLTLAGLLVALQSLSLLLYRTWTSYSHELPVPLPWMLAQFLRVLGMEAAAEQTTIHLFTMRQVQALGATWELLLPPGAWCFLVSGLVLWAIWGVKTINPKTIRSGQKNQKAPHSDWGKTARAWLRHLLPWALPVLIWLPLRVALLAGWMLHRALQTEYDDPLDLMRPFWNAWLLMGLDLPLLLLQAAWLTSCLRNRAGKTPVAPHKAVAAAGGSSALARSWRELAGGALPMTVAVVCLTLGVIWDPAGQRKDGRIAVDEFHSKWEPTERAFDTEWYGHLSGYNYWCIYDFSTRFYEMSRIKEPLTDTVLTNLDVLILKVPTEPYRPEEVEAVMRFVERGGGLLLIGEHTDVFGTGYHLNQVARRFGFEYRYDCLFGIDSFFEQLYVPSFAPHPVTRAIRGMDFATSCSIRPFQSWRGRSVITSTGLKNAPADYHASNFYPPAQDRADMRYGAFVQIWAVRHGQGRVLAFTDSTIFSNFCTFEPGKLELLRGMMEWVNRRDGIGNPRWWLLGLGAVMGAWSLSRFRRQPRLLLPMVAFGAAAWALTVAGVDAAQARSFPLPKAERPLHWVTIDRTLCDGPLSKNGFIDGKSNGFGIFERWILRLGYFIRREQGPTALADDLVVFLYPTKPVDAAFAEATRRYVEAGGHILVLDSAENTNSTAAALLSPFKLELRPHPQPDGTLEPAEGWPAIVVQAAHEVVGGVPFAQLNGRPVATRAQAGKGTVTVLGVGARFADVRMGVTGDVEPDATLRQVYEFQFRLLRWIVEGDPAPRPAEGVKPSSPSLNDNSGE